MKTTFEMWLNEEIVATIKEQSKKLNIKNRCKTFTRNKINLCKTSFSF